MNPFTDKLFDTFNRLGIEMEQVEDTFWACVHSKQEGSTQSYYSKPDNSERMFTVPYQKSFGTDQLRCDLHIEWDEFFQAYKMNSYAAAVGKAEAVDTFNAAGPFGIKLQAAYLQLSGKVSELCQSLREIGLLTTGYEVLDIKEMVNSDPATWGWEIHRVKDEANISYSVPITLTENWDIQVGDISVRFSTNPPIEHGIFNGIDTSELDARMRHIDWFHAEQLELDMYDRPIFTKEFNEVFDALEELEKAEPGFTIATMLKEKYWTEESFMGEYFTPSERTYLITKFSPGTHAEEIFRSMSHILKKEQRTAENKDTRPAIPSTKTGQDKSKCRKGRGM